MSSSQEFPMDSVPPTPSSPVSSPPSHRGSSSSIEETYTSAGALQGPLLTKPTFVGYKEKVRGKVQETFTTKQGLQDFFFTLVPFLDWFPNYPIREYLSGDLIAGITVGVMIVPQGMGYAGVANLPPVYGLYTSLLPIFTYAFFGTSRQLSVGAVAVMSLLVGTVLADTVPDPTDVDSYVRLAGVLALMVGVINTVLGVFRLGFLVSLLSPAVVYGFMSASAIIIFCTQLKDAFGVTIARSNYFYMNAFWVSEQLWSASWVAVLMCLLSVIFIFYAARRFPNFPWHLLVIIVDTVISFLLAKYTDAKLPIIKDVPQGLPKYIIPSCSSEEFSILLPQAFIIALVGFMESISISKKYAQESKYKLEPSQEFLALGFANMVGSFFGAYPSTGSFSRTAVKFNTGSKSQVSAIVAGIVVLFALLFLTPLFYYIPKCALSAVVMSAVMKLLEYEKVIEFWKTSKDDLAIFIVTFFVTLGADVDIGIGIGVGFSILVVLYRASRPHTAQLANIGGKVVPNYRNIKRHAQAALEDHMVIVRVDAMLFFANVTFVEEKLLKYLNISATKRPLRFYILEFTTIHTIDYAALEMLGNFNEKLTKKGVILLLAGVRGNVAETLIKSGLHLIIGTDNVFFNVADAVEYGKAQLKQYPIDSNAPSKDSISDQKDTVTIKDLFKPGGFKKLFLGIRNPFRRFTRGSANNSNRDVENGPRSTDQLEVNI